MLSDLFNSIDLIKIKSNFFDEGWQYINIKGNYDEEIISLIKDVANEVQSNGNSICISLDCTSILIDSIDTFGEFETWEININKVEQNKNNYHLQYFYSKEKFLDWAKKSNVFDCDYPINKFDKIKIIVKDIPNDFGGEHVFISNNIDKEFCERLYDIPDKNKVSKFVNCISHEPLTINPLNNFIAISNCNDIYSKPFLVKSALTLISSFVNEFYNDDKIILQGIKRVQLKLSNGDISLTLKQLHSIAELVSWIYEDKIETRQKLFVDRITLDINYDYPLISELIRVIDSAFLQAKERYNFVIIDRQENYLKEVRDLLKDIKSQSDLYSSKIRSLVNNLLRDVLAGFILIGFTLLPKVSEITKLVKADNYFMLIFRALSIYYLVSVLIQVAIDVTDMIISKKEIKYWKNVSRNYIPESEFKNHIKLSLKNRTLSVWVFYFILVLCYFCISGLFWKYPIIFNEFLTIKK